MATGVFIPLLSFCLLQAALCTPQRLLGEWYDVGRTTYIWGQGTWTSQQWNFVQGRDGTMVALFNGMCKTCGGCSETKVYRVTRLSDVSVGFLLQGNGEIFSLHIMRDLQTDMVVSLCFDGSVASMSECPQSKLQVSVLSRQPVMTDLDRWLTIISSLPGHVNSIDSSSGESCPKLYIDPRLVDNSLIQDADSQLVSMVGFDSRRSSLVLPCSLGEQAPSMEANNKVVWVREQTGATLTINDTVLASAGRSRMLRATPGDFHLQLRGVSQREADVYVCFLQTGGRRLPLSRIAVSSGDFPASPSIVYHSSEVITKKGESPLLECYASGNPPPLVTWWVKTSGEQEAYVKKEKQGARMRIRDVQSSDEGVYKCEASSGVGSPVSALISLQVGFAPETEVEESAVSLPFSGQLRLTCQVKIKSPDTIVWQIDGTDIDPDDRRSVSLIKMSDYVYNLQLLIGQMRKEDFGQYACFAQDRWGASLSSVQVAEEVSSGDHCQLGNIPVMPNFNVQQYLGDMERMQTTSFYWGNNTYESEVQGFFITISGSLVQYYRGFSPQKKHCLDPGATSLVRLETPGDYIITLDGQRGRYKIIYSDYMHAVTYLCMGGSYNEACPQHLVHVQILSRQPHIPDDVLQVLYSYVQRTCVPVTSLVDTVPGICRMPTDFMYSRGWIGRYPELNCQVAHLRTQGEITPHRVTGSWHLISEVRPQDYDLLQRNSVHIASLDDRLILLHRGTVESGLCSATVADVLYKSATAGSFYYNYRGRTVDAKILYVDDQSLVLYTCFAVRHDGSCFDGSQLVELYHRDLDIDNLSMLWLTRAVASACVNVKMLHRLQPSDDCPVPQRVVTAASSGLVNGDRSQIGCHQNLIPVAEDFRGSKFAGHWTVMSRNADSLADRDNAHQFSLSYHVLQRPEGRLLLLIRHYESDWGLCPPTRILEVTQQSGPGDYIHVSHSMSVVFKVLALYDSTAVVYWCRNPGSDGVCRPESLTLEILARSPDTDIPDSTLRAMQQCSVSACVNLPDLLPTSQEEKCRITEDIISQAQGGSIGSVFDIPAFMCDGQLLRGMSDVNVEKLTGEWTVLWRNEEFWGVRAPYAESSFIILTHYGILYLWRSYDNDLQRCSCEEAGRFVTTSGPGDYYSGFDGVPVAMKILATDYTSMLVLWCHLDDNSRCHPHRTTIEILSRNATSLGNDTRDALMASVNMSCLDSPRWVSSEPDTCRVENDVLTSAYIDGLNGVEYSKIGCRIDLVESQAAVVEDGIIGSWVSVYQTNTSSSGGLTARMEYHFFLTAEGSLSLLYRGVDGEQCLPASAVELTRDEGVPGTVFQLRYCSDANPYGYVYVLYYDGDRLALLVCKEVHKDNTCHPDMQTMVLLHREGTTLSINDTVLSTVTALAADACVDPESLVIPTLDPCAVPEVILNDAAEGAIQACAVESAAVQCYPRYVPLQPAFSLGEFAGTWYTSGGTGPDSQPVDQHCDLSTTYHFTSRSDGTIAMLSTTGCPGACQPTQLRLLRSAGDGSFIFTINNTQEPYPVPENVDLTEPNNYQIGLMKVVRMDANFALTYWCFDTATGDPWCGSMDVVVMSRQPPSGQGQSWPAELQPLLADLCVPWSEFVSLSSDPCPVPDDIVTAVEAENTTVAASFSVIQCAEQFVPAVRDFDMTLFSGVWHTVRQTRLRWGNNTWESLIRSFVVHNETTAIMAFTGLPPSHGQCEAMDIRMFQLPNHTVGQWSYEEGSQTVAVKVVWTDYNTSAVLYTCVGQVREDGLCPRDSLQVEFLSRSTALPAQAVEETMMAMLPFLCVEEEEVESMATGLCQITEELEHLVRSQTDGAAQPAEACRMQDIALDRNFTLRQMEGIWYEVARTRFTFNTMESVISVYEYNQENGNLDGLFIGTLQKQCQSPLKSVTRKKFADGPESVIEGRIQVGESIFPWITFNILHFDGDILIHLACYAENSDGTCSRDKTEVTVLGRTRQLTESVEEKLDDLMRGVCLKKEDLVPTQETADCLPKLMRSEDDVMALPDTSGCQLRDIPVVDNFSDADLLGTWYGLGSLEYSAKREAAGFVVSVTHSTASALQWRQWNIRNGSCQAEKTVYVKAACTDSNTGDYISTKASSFMLQWTTLKILQFSGNLLLVYTCTQETHQGACTPQGAHVLLLGRAPTTTLDDMIPLLGAVPSVCLNAEDMKSVQSSVDCDYLASETVPSEETSRCAVDRLPSADVEFEEVSGLWYEIARTVDKMFPMKNAAIVYQALPGHQLAIYHAAMDPSGQCHGPMQGQMRPRCQSNPGVEKLGRLMFPGIWSWAPWRLLHADNASLIGLSCMDQQRDGSCSSQGLKIHILARDPNPDAILRQSMHALLEQTDCFDDTLMEDVYPDGTSCRHKLDPILDGMA